MSEGAKSAPTGPAELPKGVLLEDGLTNLARFLLQKGHTRRETVEICARLSVIMAPTARRAAP